MKTQEAITTIDRQDFFRLVGVSIGAIVLQQCLSGCNTGASDPQPVKTPSDFSINVNNANFAALRNAGGFVRTNGLIIARTNQGGFIAVSQACTHEGTPVNFVSSNNTFLCPNHGSVFSGAGEVQNGPATKPLTVYKTTFDASTGDVRVFI
jgi:cytochrome b6-f complex iron-sulfur subunit